jgi:hypothetical protein
MALPAFGAARPNSVFIEGACDCNNRELLRKEGGVEVFRCRGHGNCNRDDVANKFPEQLIVGWTTIKSGAYETLDRIWHRLEQAHVDERIRVLKHKDLGILVECSPRFAPLIQHGKVFVQFIGDDSDDKKVEVNFDEEYYNTVVVRKTPRTYKSTILPDLLQFSNTNKVSLDNGILLFYTQTRSTEDDILGNGAIIAGTMDIQLMTLLADQRNCEEYHDVVSVLDGRKDENTLEPGRRQLLFDFGLIDRVVTYKGAIYIPEVTPKGQLVRAKNTLLEMDMSRREALLVSIHHDWGAHPTGASMAKLLIQSGVRWPTMNSDCAALVEACSACVRARATPARVAIFGYEKHARLFHT